MIVLRKYGNICRKIKDIDNRRRLIRPKTSVLTKSKLKADLDQIFKIPEAALEQPSPKLSIENPSNEDPVSGDSLVVDTNSGVDIHIENPADSSSQPVCCDPCTCMTLNSLTYDTYVFFLQSL